MSRFKGSPYRRQDLEVGDSRSGGFDGDDDAGETSSGPFDIDSTKNIPIARLRRWRQAALVLNASRRFRYTLDLKKEEDRKQIIRKIRAHAQVIRAAYLFKEAGDRANGIPISPPIPNGDYGIGQEELASMTRDHNSNALQQYDGARLAELLKTNLEKGILGDDADLLRRRNAFGSNTYPRKKEGVSGCFSGKLGKI
ncbi:Calcium-transporting ATPase 10, plasma membrane-type [Vitis vinifera]|uniref:Calcium-transporting ATPase 10, plasma membrane-type n=1 Tax=Vitis vinifera TaxID=29760 RepID=A0A438GUS6_VITVI|nr:Calcium-transporting ATPase 10, plasma membrane-type [Vitis vinifera]